MADKTKAVTHAKHVPKDAQVIMSIMKDMGISDYEPKVINQLLEFVYRYITCILDDSKIYANHAKKKFIDLEDVRLAVKMQLDRTFTNPPPRDVLLDVAKSKNNIPLPFVKPNNGLRLPPDRYCLNSANYRLRNITKKQAGKMHTLGNNVGASSRLKGDANKPMSIVKRPGTLSTVARTQTISVPKPVFKFSTVPKPIQRCPPPSNPGYKFIVKIQPRSASSGTASTGTKPKIQIGAGPGTSVIKMEVEESAKRKREDDDYDVP